MPIRRVIPDIYTEYLDGQLGTSAPALANVEAKIGAAQGGIPGQMYAFAGPTAKQDAKTVFKGGPLLRAIHEAFDAGSSTIYAWRIGPATFAEATLSSATPEPVLKLRSRIPGSYWNGFDVQVVYPSSPPQAGEEPTLIIRDLNTNPATIHSFTDDSAADLVQQINGAGLDLEASLLGPGALAEVLIPVGLSGGDDGLTPTNGDFIAGLDLTTGKGEVGAFFWYPDVNAGLVSLYVVPPGTLNDGDPIDFSSPAVTIDAQGIKQLRELAGVGRTTETVYGNAQALIAEAQTRLNTDNALDARITNEAGASGAALAALQSGIDTEGVERINADVNTREQIKILQGTPNWSDLPADNIASIDARLSMLAGGGGSGLPLHHTKHEAGGNDEVRFDDLADGSAFKKMTAAERGDIATAFAHATDASIHLSAAEKTDLTDGGDATVHHHDSRYYQKGYVDGALNAKSDVGHHHDARYLRRVWSGSNLVENGQTVVFVTLDHAPDHIAISANDPGTLGEPTNPTYCMGPRITGLHVEIEKISGSPDKDYVVRVNNGYGFDLWVNLDVFSID